MISAQTLRVCREGKPVCARKRRCAPSPRRGEGWGEGRRSLDSPEPLTRFAEFYHRAALCADPLANRPLPIPTRVYPSWVFWLSKSDKSDFDERLKPNPSAG